MGRVRQSDEGRSSTFYAVRSKSKLRAQPCICCSLVQIRSSVFSLCSRIGCPIKSIKSVKKCVAASARHPLIAACYRYDDIGTFFFSCAIKTSTYSFIGHSKDEKRK